MTVMAARIALIASPTTLPTSVTIGGVVTQIFDTTFTGSINGRVAREFRSSAHPNRVLVVVRGPAVTLPDSRAGFLCLIWVPASARDGDDAFFATVRGTAEFQAVVVGHWPVTVDVDGSLIITALEADGGAAALVALAAWPATWRKRLPSDPQDQIDGTPGGPSTGARIVAESLA